RRERGDDAGVPRAHELHRGLVVGDEAGGGAGALLRRGGEEAVVEGLGRGEVRERLTGLQPALVLEGARLGGRLHGLLRAVPQGEEVVPVGRRPCVHGPEGDVLDPGGLERVDGVFELGHRRRRGVDAGLREQVLAVVDAAGEHRGGHAVDPAVDREGAQRTLTDRGTGRVVDVVGEVQRLADGHDVGQLATAPRHEDVRCVPGVEGGLQFPVHVLVLDGLDGDRHPGVGRLEVRDGVLPVLLALPRGRVVPEGHRDVAVTSSGAVVAAAGREPEGRDHHRRRGRQCLASCHGSVLWSGGGSIDRPARVRRSAGGNGDSTRGGGGVVIEITSGRHQPWPPPTMAALTPVCQSLSITFYYRWSVRDSAPARARLDADRGTMRVCRPAAAWQDRGGRPSTGDRRAEGVTVPGENLTRQEAAERAALVDVESYDVELDLTRGERVFASRTTISFSARTGASTFVDLIADTVHEIRLNGRYLDPHAWDGARITLTDLEERNELLVVADARYMRTGEGLHRFVDPVDDEVYLYSQFEVADSRRVFAVFEQPDLKASFRFTVTAPRHWTVVSNSPTPEPEPAPDHHDAAVWRFAPTPRIPSYITAV